MAFRMTVAALAALLLLVGAGPAAAQDETPPVITNAVVTPGSLPNTGGTVTISADVTDDVGVHQVWAEVSSTNGVYDAVALTNAGGTLYRGTYQVGPNWTDEEVGYQFTVRAWDAVPNEGEGYAGEVSVAAQPQFDEPPDVWDAQLSPVALGSGGGPVTIHIRAWDLRGISYSYARVTAPGGALTDLELIPIGSDTFEGVFTAPANTGAAAQTYSVRATAQDDIGQETWVDVGSFTVAGRPALSPARLVLTPGTAAFPAIPVGATARKTVVLRNTGPRSSVPIVGTIGAPGGPFTLVGAGPDGIPFTLASGQTKTVVVEFRPTSKGGADAPLRVTRADGAQGGLAVRLSGRGR